MALAKTVRSRRLRQTAGVLLIATLAWVGFTALRIRKLKEQGQVIALQSSTFKTDYFVGDAKAPELTYLVLGDSTAAGWGAERLEATYPYKIAQAMAREGYRIHVVNFAVGGATIGDVCQKQLVSVWTAQPDIITVSVGANDALRGTAGNEYAENMRVLLSSLQNSTAQTILFANTPDMSQVPALPLPVALMDGMRARRLNLVLFKAERGPKVQIVDLFERGKLVYGQDPKLYAADLFHPSDKGYGRWADLYTKKLNLSVK